MPFWWRRKEQGPLSITGPRGGGAGESSRGNKPREPSSIPGLLEALAALGLTTTAEAFDALVERLLRAADVRHCLPEETHSILLQRTDSGYGVMVPLTLAGRQEVLAKALRTAGIFAAVSELARESGVAKYVLEPQGRIAVCGPNWDLEWREQHAILALLHGLQFVC